MNFRYRMKALMVSLTLFRKRSIQQHLDINTLSLSCGWENKFLPYGRLFWSFMNITIINLEVYYVKKPKSTDNAL